MLLAGKIDLGLMSTPVRDRRLVSRRVFDDELVLIASKHHRFAQQTRVRLAQMRDETLFVYPPKEESGPLQNVLLPAGAAPARVEEVQLTEAITELVKAGLGVAILARWAVQPLIDAGSIVGRSLPARGMHRVWSAVMPKDLARDRLRQRVHRSAREARADDAERQTGAALGSRSARRPAPWPERRPGGQGWVAGRAAVRPGTPTAPPSDARRSLPPSSMSSFGVVDDHLRRALAAAFAQRCGRAARAP